jgi:hypothetical protein
MESMKNEFIMGLAVLPASPHSTDAYTRKATRTYDCVMSTNISRLVESDYRSTTFSNNSARRRLTTSSATCPAWTHQCGSAVAHSPASATRRSPDLAIRPLGDSERFR